MATEKTKSIVVSLANGNHPSGVRRRAGFVFTTEAIEIEVTAEQLKLIKADECLKIHGEAPKAEKTDEADKGTAQIDDAKSKGVEAPKADGLKEELVKELTEKGLVDGVDFNSADDILVLQELLDKQPPANQ